MSDTEYTITSPSGFSVNVSIKQPPNEFIPVYELKIPSLSDATRIIIDNKIKYDLIKRANVDIRDLLDPNKYDYVRSSYRATAEKILRENFREIDDRSLNILVEYLLLTTVGLGELEIIGYDENIEEICVNGASSPIWIYHKRFGWCKTNIYIKKEEDIYNYASTIARRVGRQINILNPLLDATLPDGSRVNATLHPISNFGNTITIRKFSKNPWTITRLIKNNTLSSEVAALVWTYVQNEISILIAGGTGSGKTSVLNSIAEFIPPNQRVISIEDTRELTLPKYLQWVPLVVRQPNPEGKGEISMLDLLVNSLRMRPDRILVGEVRRQREAEIMFEAMRTGHSVYSTIHADSANQAVNRLTTPPINLPKEMLDSLGIIMVQVRNRRDNVRKTFEVAEVLENGEVNILYRWNFKRDLYEKRRMKRTFELFEIYLGWKEDEVMIDIKEKEHVLNWMVKQEYYDVDRVGYLVSRYYKNPEEIMEFAANNRRWEFDE
ncbi:MAG: ATPase, T2SS/T4P/T4SS family [Candidatus Micrarchaeota archaeon]|nr:ATPase, T2SS/T4P/T4SS family [Candidatus Micrarchaeota archaeon]MCX8154585.1 ATPase, T2SS/T4P/T4SS family [Candidatus Micrarchaeota archaeon]